RGRVTAEELNAIYTETPEARAAREASAKVDGLQQQVSQLTHALHGQNHAQATMANFQNGVAGFAAAHEDFEELAPAIAADLRSGADRHLIPAERLKAAYLRAKSGKSRADAGS